jgi:hypothetical protein
MKDLAFERAMNAMQRTALLEFAISIFILIVLFWATYYVIKAGVRDGIRESGLRERSNRQMAPHGYKWALVKEFADTKPMHVD